MRTRLLSLLLIFMALSLAAIAVPAARGVAQSDQQSVYLDRLNDTTRFAALAQQDSSLSDLDSVCLNLSRYDGVYGIAVVVVQRDGSIECASRAGIPTATPEVREAVATAFAGRPSDDPHTIWPWQNRQLVVATPVMHSGDITGAAVTLSPTGELRRDILVGWAFIALVAAVVLLMGVLLAIWLTRWILRPVYTLDSATHTIATGQLDARVSKAGGPPELRRLAGSFNAMADHVQSSIKRQQAFVADASHQLRNPLSALLLRLEHLGTALPAGWEDELANAREEGVRLTQVLDDLLTLAAAEHTTLIRHPVEVAALVDERLAAWSAMAEHEEILLRRAGAENAHAVGDEAALRGVLDVLISNALKFSPAGTEVTVTLRQDGSMVAIDVRDRGAGLPDEELARLGDRFWRSPQHQNVAGSGLGIAIAKTLLDGIGGRLELTTVEPHGLLATVHLRTAIPELEPPALEEALEPAQLHAFDE